MSLSPFFFARVIIIFAKIDIYPPSHRQAEVQINDDTAGGREGFSKTCGAEHAWRTRKILTVKIAGRNVP